MAVTYLTPKLELDPYSGKVIAEDWSEPTATDAGAAFVLSSATSQSNDGTNETTSLAWTLHIPEGSPSPGARDRVAFDGQVFVLDGRPIRERSPFTGWAPYAQVRLERTEG